MKTPDDTAIHASLADATFRAYREAVIRLPPDVLRVIKRAAAAETNPLARGEFANILKNIEEAERLGVPLCQDTGVPVVYLTIPSDVPLTRGLYEGVAEGVRRATREIPLRPNVVDPLSRHNTGDNTGPGMPAIHVRPGDRFTVTVLPKGPLTSTGLKGSLLRPCCTRKEGPVPRLYSESGLAALSTELRRLQKKLSFNR
jgi:fumarate hydratase subunit alpha